MYGVGILDVIRMLQPSSYVLLLRVEYESGEPDIYMLPATVARGEAGAGPVVAPLRAASGERGALYESTADRAFAGELLNVLSLGRKLPGEAGELSARKTAEFERIRRGAASLEPKISKAEQSNSSVIYGDAFILKLFRRLERGTNPDLEIGAYLTGRGFAHTPPVAGAIEYRTARGGCMTVGILQGFVPNEGDAWAYTLREVEAYVQRGGGIGRYLDSAGLLGRRTAEMHAALAAGETPEFAPEPLTAEYRRVLADRITAQTEQAFDALARRAMELPDEAKEEALAALPMRDAALARCRAIADQPIRAMRTRHHGDYHLGQVLWTGGDFVIIDFEGEPLRPLRERRMKRSPVRDVAGMLRSFDYAASTAAAGRPELAESWTGQVSARFLSQYLETARGAPFLPPTREEFDTLLAAYLIEKASYEVLYELNNRPGWVGIPLRGIERLLR
jgi:trehalose synthase-fused probable maltokinase